MFIKVPERMPITACFLANVNAMSFDYVVRRKVGGINFTYSYLEQLPALPPQAYDLGGVTFILPRVMELVYTAWDIKRFADDAWRQSEEGLKDVIRCQWEENKGATGGHEWSPPEWADIAKDGIPLPPFKWDEDRRARIRMELDACYALLYGLSRKQLRYWRPGPSAPR